jgi:hypothetical protein
MTLLGAGNRFNWTTSNASAPVAAGAGGLGTSLTSGAAHTVGSTVQLLSALAEDAYGILIYANACATTASDRQLLYNIRTDPAGGTAWTTVIANLYCCNPGYVANTLGLLGGFWFYFPLFIKAGSTVGADFQCATATQTSSLWVTVFGKPSRPDMVKAGSYVEAFGADTANSRGTAITKGVSSAEGASWTQLGSNTTRPFWAWQFGVGGLDPTVGNINAMWDLAAGDGSNYDMIFENQLSLHTGQEAATMSPSIINMYREVPSGVGLYARLSINSGTAADFNAHYAVAYGIGG